MSIGQFLYSLRQDYHKTRSVPKEEDEAMINDYGSHDNLADIQSSSVNIVDAVVVEV